MQSSQRERGEASKKGLLAGFPVRHLRLEQENTALIAIKQRKGRGGRRPGAGRKPDYLKRLGITPMKAAEILAHHDEPKLWSGLLNSKSEEVRFRTLSYLTDRRDGKPKQQVDVSGGLMHAHTVYRDPRLANLSAEELASLDSLTRKLVATSQDGPQNQKESNTAIEALDTVESPSNEAGSSSDVLHDLPDARL